MSEGAVAFWWWVGGVMMGVGMSLLAATKVCAEEEIHHHDGMSTAVDRFYSRWQKPDMRFAKDHPLAGRRYVSCCSRTDCHPTPVKQDPRTGEFYAEIEGDRWPIPSAKVEETQADFEESPDGQGHACYYMTRQDNRLVGVNFHCAVRGAGM